MDRDELAMVLLAGLREPLALESGSIPTPSQMRAAADAALAYFREYLEREQTVEAVARVICSTSLEGGDPDSKNGMGAPIWTEWKPDASAALVALSPKVQEGE